MAIPVIVSSTTSIATANSLTLTIPSGVSNGDLLVILVGNDNGAAGEGFIDNTTGWTQHYSYGDGTSDCYMGLYSKIADGTNEDSVTINSTDADDIFGWYLHVTGQNATSPIRVVGASQISVSSSVTVDALTTDTNTYSLAVSQMSYDGSDATPFTESGTGWTLGDWLQSPDATSGNYASGAYSTKDISTASTTTGTSILTGNGTSDGIVASSFVIAGTETAGAINVEITEVGVTGTFTSDVVVVSTVANVSIDDTSVTLTGTSDDVVVSASINVNIDDAGSILTSSSDLATVSTTHNINVSDSSIQAVFTSDDVSVSTSANIYSTVILGTLTSNDVVVTTASIVSIEIVDGGVVLTSTPNAVSIVGDSNYVDSTTTASFTSDDVVVGLGSNYSDTGLTVTITPNTAQITTGSVISVNVDDAGIEISSTSNDVSVSAIKNVSIDDSSVLCTITSNTHVASAIQNVDIAVNELLLSSTANSATVSTDSGSIEITDNGVTLTATVNVPSIQCGTTIVVTSSTFISSVNSVSIFARDNSNAVSLSVGGEYRYSINL